ncbi:YeeE/YedE family protein [Xanthobacter sp. VTT E-85238]
MTSFTPLPSLLGGMLIGLSAVLLMAGQGRIAGISGIASRLLPPYEGGGILGRLGFVAGLIAAPLLAGALTGLPVVQAVSDNLALMGAAGLLVGFGSVWGGGCTSGHGVCGIARLSPRSLVATLVFMGVAGVTVFVTRHLMGG